VVDHHENVVVVVEVDVVNLLVVVVLMPTGITPSEGKMFKHISVGSWDPDLGKQYTSVNFSPVGLHLL